MVKPYEETSAIDYAPEPADNCRSIMEVMKSAPAPDSELRKYRLLSPNAGVRVSPICLGAMSIGDQWTGILGGKLNVEESEAYLDYKAGGNFIDIANDYHDEQSEMIIGEWMEKRGIRNDMVIATKYGAFYPNRRNGSWIEDKGRIGVNYCGVSKKSLRQSLDASLKKLRTDYIDILYVHFWDHTTCIAEMMQSLAEVVRSGKVLYLGISNTPAWVVSQANEYAKAHALPQFVVYQGQYNYAIRDMERDIIPMCRNNGMSIAPWAIMGQGMFKSAEDLVKKGRQGAAKQTEEQKQICDILEEVAKEIGDDVKLAHVGLAWARQMYSACFPILGGTSIEQLQSNIDALKITLTDAQMQKLDKANPFNHGFPTGVCGTDPRALPGQVSDNFILPIAGHIQFPKAA